MNVPRRVGAHATLVVVTVVLGAAGLAAQTQIEGSLAEAATRPGVAPPLKEAKLSGPLVRIADRAAILETRGQRVGAAALAAADATVAAWIESGSVRLDAERGIHVFAHAVDSIGALVAALRDGGGEVERVAAEQGLVQAWIPLARVRELSEHPAVARLRLPDYARRQAGSALSEGDAILNADLLRQQLGVDGTGIRVGVISDGVNGLSAARASGDLPFVDTTTCNVVPGSNPQRAGAAEGTAMLEIVHDLAPGAELFFGNFGFATVLDFNAAVDCLAERVDVVVDDISFFGVGSYDGTSLVSKNTRDALNAPGNPIRAYLTSVGNQALNHYQERFVDSGIGFLSTQAHRFGATNLTADAGVGFPCSSGGGTFCGNTVFLPAGADLQVILVWDDPWNASSNDYDLFLIDTVSGDTVAESADLQSGSQSPVEAIDFTNQTGSGRFYAIAVGLFGAGSARELDIFVLCAECEDFPGGSVHNFNTAASSVPNQADAGGGVLSVASINVQDPNNDTVAPYSSRGPTNDGTLKPDLTAIDGVDHSSPTGFPSPFFGTSAAAPHAAAVAALLLDLNRNLLAGEPGDSPSADRLALREALLAGTVDLGAAGPDTSYGYGRIDAVASANALGLAGECVESALDLCLSAGRFRVSAVWRDPLGSGNSGVGNAVPLTADTGYFWFFDPANVELVVKVLDARAVNGNFWVFYGALSNVEYTITVTDTDTGRSRTYFNEAGEFGSLGDTAAFSGAGWPGDEPAQGAGATPADLATGAAASSALARIVDSELNTLLEPLDRRARPSVRAPSSGLIGPEGSSYEVTLLLGGNVDADPEIELFSVQDGAGDNVVRFDDATESIVPLGFGLGTQPRVSESIADLGGGRLALEIEISSQSGTDLCPPGFVGGAGETPLDLCGFAIGLLQGTNPLDWSPPHRVVSARAEFLRNDTLREAFDLSGLGLFGENSGNGNWDGNFGLVFQNVVGRNANRIRLELEVEQEGAGGVDPFDCEGGPSTLCLNDDRFQVEVEWTDFAGESGAGRAVERTSDTGTFWFFDPANVELIVKVLDARAVNGNFWVFYGALSNVEFTITVTDSETGRVKTYFNPLGIFASVGDTSAFSGSGTAATSVGAPAALPSSLWEARLDVARVGAARTEVAPD